MKLVSTDKKPSYRDKVGDKQIYVCPTCRGKGYDIPSITVSVTYTAPLLNEGCIELGRGKDRQLTCPQCGEIIAEWIKNKWRIISAK